MKKLVILVVVLAFIWAVPPLRNRVGAAALPVLEKLGPAADFVVNPIREYSARNKVEHVANVIGTDALEGRTPPDARNFDNWMRTRMSGESGLDPWGNPYWLQRARGSTIVGSSGADGERGTEDDIAEAVSP